MPADQTQPDDDLPDDPAPGPKKQPAQKPARRPDPDPDPEPAAEPKKHTHTARLTKLALEMGFTQADLDDFPSDVIWEEIDRIRAAEARPADPPPRPEPAAAAARPADPDEEYLAELEKVDPALAKLLRRAAAGPDLKPIHEKLAKLDALEAAEQRRQARATTRAIDAAFAALPAKFLPLVGEGPIEELTDPGQKGWRGAIYQKAGLAAGDGPKAVAAKIARAAEEVAGPHVKEPAAASAYDRAANGTPKAPRPDPARDPNGRFTAEDFARGQVHRPTGRQTGPDNLDDVEQARRYMREHGDPRGSLPRAVIEDDDLPGDD